MPFDALQRAWSRERVLPGPVGAVAVGLVAVAIVFAAAVVLSVAIAGNASAGAGALAGVDATAGTNAVDPTLSVPDDVNRSENLTATVGLPETANETGTLRVRLEPRLGTAAAVRNVTLAPGETTTVDFGACLAPETYAVRVVDADGDILVADQTEINAVDAPLTFADHETIGFSETVRPNDDLRLDATLHACVDRATLALDDPESADDDVVWAVTLVDRDGDDAIGLSWDVDGTGRSALTVSDGDALTNVTAPDEPVGYGRYGFNGVVAGNAAVAGYLTVSFADPTVEVYAVNRTATASEAIERARATDTSPLEGRGDPVLDDQWVVVRVDTDDTLDSLAASDRLVAPARHENATVRARVQYGPRRSPAETSFDLPNATRRFDAESATVWYAVRVNDSLPATHVEYVAIGDAWNATAEASFHVAPRAVVSYPEGMMLPPNDSVSIPGGSVLPAGTTFAVEVQADDRVLARDTVTVRDDGSFEADLDLTGVANGTNATVVVRRDDRELATLPVVIDARPDLVLRGFRPESLSRTGESTVRVYLENQGTEPGRTNVTVSIGNASANRTVRVPAQQTTTAEISVPTSGLDAPDSVLITVATDDDVEARDVEIEDDPPPPNRFTTVQSTTRPVHTTERWPTLAGSRSPDGDSPLPGFGPAIAVGALLAIAVALARRRTG